MGSNGPDALTLHCREVTVRFLERAVVPPYEGSMIRGAFKESCCPFPHDGEGCPLGETCPYGYVFETSPPENAREFAKYREVPRPYAFEPPEAPPFAALVQNLLIRLPMLSAVHCGEVWQEDFKALVARAGEVETIRDETTWASLRRHSSFKNRVETLEGIVGHTEYAGPLEEFLPCCAWDRSSTLASARSSGRDATSYRKPECPGSRAALTATAARSIVSSGP